MCHILLHVALLAYVISHAEGRFTIRARKGNVTTTNHGKARLEWYFSYQQTTNMEITMVNRWGVITKRIAYKGPGGRFLLYDIMKSRATISTPYSRNGVVIDIMNIVISDSGNYRCQATLTSGKTVQNITTLNVLVPPRINAQQIKLSRIQDQNASLLCNLEAGNPKPLSFQWFKVYEYTRDKYRRHAITPVKWRDYNLTYYIENVGRDDVGKYECVVRGRRIDSETDGGTDSHKVDLYVQYKPVVTVPPLNRSVLEDFGVGILECTCDSNAGAITYHWYKDCSMRQCEIRNSDQKWRRSGIQIINNGRGLKFVRPLRSLAAIYYCAGSNTLGLGRAKGAFLNVTYQPGSIEIATVDGTNINVFEGTNTTVNCYSNANPPPHYNWFKLVRTFLGTYEKERLVTSSLSGDLKLAHVDRNDTAEYICEAFNRPNYEVISTVYTVTRKVSIKIIFGPRQTNFTINKRNYTYQEVKQYSRVVMRCVTHSEPGADYNMRKELDQTQLNKDVKKGLYVIERIEEHHEGTYTCAVTNSLTHKTKTKRIELVVSVPPKAIAPIPGSQIIAEGSTISINCHVTGKPAPSVFYQRWGVNITHNDSVIQTSYKVRPVKWRSLFVVDAELKFTRIRYTDDGSYSCVFNNTGGILNTTNIRYRVQYPPKLTPTGYPGNFTRLEGEKAKFVCQAHANPEPVQWKWLFNDIEIPGEITNTYERSYTARKDNGYYQCVPRNPLGDGQIGIGYLEVQYEPTFILIPDGNYTRDQKESITIRCDAEAVPIPEIFWTKLSDSSFHRVGKELSFDSLEPNDMGLYSCVARNVVSSRSVSTTIIIRHRPIITTNTPSDTKIGSEEGSLVHLQCDVKAYPEAKITWKDYIKDTVITSGQNYKIVEKGKTLSGKSSILMFTVQSYQLGKKYVCHAENKYGPDDQTFQVLRRGKPDPPVRLSLKATDELVPTIPVTVNINITWIPGYSGGAEVGYYLLYREYWESQYQEHFMELTQGFRYIMKNMKASTQYIFTMKAQNKYGVSQLYDPAYALTTKDPPADVANVTYERYGKDGTSVVISWYIFPVVENKRVRREVTRKWSYGIVRYRIADVETEWREEEILKIQTKGSYLVENLHPEQLYVFHFILYDEDGYFGRPMLIGRFYPGYGYGYKSELTQAEIIAIGVGCGGAILIAIILIVICKKKKKKSAYGKASYGKGATRVDVVSPVRNGAHSKEIARTSYYKAEEFLDDDDDDLIPTDSGDKSPPPAYNDIHETAAPHEEYHVNHSTTSDDQPLLNGSVNHSDGKYENTRKSSGHYGSRDELSGAEKHQNTRKSQGHYGSRDEHSDDEKHQNTRKSQGHYGSRDEHSDDEKHQNTRKSQGHYGSRDELSGAEKRQNKRKSQGHYGSRDELSGAEKHENTGKSQGVYSSREHLSSAEKHENTGQWNSREELSAGDEHFSKEPHNMSNPSDGSPNLNTSSYSINSDLQQAHKLAEKYKKVGVPPYKPLDDEHGGSGRGSPINSSVASSKPYQSENEYIDEDDKNYDGQLV